VQEGSVFHENSQFDSQVIFDWLINLSQFKSQNYLPLVALFIPFMSMFRLAKFNIDTRQSVSFIGLPTPANTIFFTAFPLILAQVPNANTAQLNLITSVFQPTVLIPIIILMSLFLVAEIPLFALKLKHFGWKGNEIRYSYLTTCLLLIPFLLVWSIPIIVLLYIVLSIIENVFLKKKKNEIQS
jgi:CDP-diacylglycerol--serine O-phosphatidyltransferase